MLRCPAAHPAALHLQLQQQQCIPAAGARQPLAPAAGQRPQLGRRQARSVAPRCSAAGAGAASSDCDAQGAAPALALKEWAVTNAALSAGEQTVVLRKGGIREPRFGIRSPWFLLFPTDFHVDEALLKPAARRTHAEELRADVKAAASLRLATLACVMGAWTTKDAAALHALEPFHIWSEAYVRQRAEWRPSVPATVIELRCWRLAQPVELPNRPELWGCFSWVEAPGVVAGELLQRARTPALPDAQFAERQAALRAVVGAHAFAAVDFPRWADPRA